MTFKDLVRMLAHDNGACYQEDQVVGLVNEIFDRFDEALIEAEVEKASEIFKDYEYGRMSDAEVLVVGEYDDQEPLNQIYTETNKALEWAFENL